MITNKIVIASDHAGYLLKEEIKNHLIERGIKIKDLGTNSSDSVDYPDYGHRLSEVIENGDYEYGISICGTGNGISMTANKHSRIRSGIVWNEEIARLIRWHNDANICSIPARFVDSKLALRMVDIFLSTDFEGGRHIIRLEKIPIK
jgi:ribose 5-phosphate isomerase B